MNHKSLSGRQFLPMGPRIWLPVLIGLWIALPAGMVNAAPVEGPVRDPVAGTDLYVVGPGSWTETEAESRALGGHLVTITSAAENDFIFRRVLLKFVASGGPDLSTRPLWIGLHDPTGASQDDGPGGPTSDHAANFRWVSGSVSTYRNWNAPSSQPDDYIRMGTGEYYGTINWHTAQGNGPGGTWNDAPLNGSSGFGGNTDGPYYGIAEVPIRSGTLAMTGTGKVELALELSDGSHVIGTPSIDRLKVSTDYANFDIPLSCLNEIEFTGTNPVAAARLVNGDSLTVRLSAKGIDLKTIFGPVTIPIAIVRKIEATTPDDNAPPAPPQGAD
jgi:hypothetical protein